MAQREPLSPRRRPQQARSRELVRAIAMACERILVDEGAAALNTNRIAEVAGVNIGSVYRYFPNKEAIIAEVYELQLQDLAAEYEDGWEAAQAGPGPRTLTDAVRAHIAGNAAMHRRLLRIDDAFYRAYQRELDLGERRSERFDRTFLEQAEHWLRDQLAVHRASLVVTDLDMAAFLVARSVAGALRSAARDQPERLADAAFLSALERMALLYLEGNA
ncbi:MAG: helix-turn-helix domain-containing protein [Polyangiales bacterium]|nr:TetR/AcrR family transcriptional regulator [Myxococcales bacterium]MCB9659969.1 TetR/AcrR family transcriptional regulator [Sandaracinaceae bacterium]